MRQRNASKEVVTENQTFLRLRIQSGDAFGIDLYGLDIVVSDDREYVVDINTFPGFKGVSGAGRLLADYITRVLDRPGS